VSKFRKLYVTLTQFFYLSGVARTGKGHFRCKISHFFYEECDCLQKVTNETRWNQTDYTVDLINDAIERVAIKYHRYNNRSDVGVHLFSGLKGEVIDDLDFLSSLDCFHPSAAAHHWLGNSAWGSMFGFPQKKPVKGDDGKFIFEDAYCPPDAHTPFISGPQTFGEQRSPQTSEEMEGIQEDEDQGTNQEEEDVSYGVEVIV